MGDLPLPKSFNAILGSMMPAVSSRGGFNTFKVGNPLLSVLEATSQVALRSSQDLFGLLNSISLDRSSGVALERYGNDRKIPKERQSRSSGFVTIGDSSFEKVSTRIFQGQGAPIVGSNIIYVINANGFNGAVVGANPGSVTTGNIYIGRGTLNYEGPLPYNQIDDLGSYWAINLTTGTQKFHDLGEEVVFAQGGNRSVNAGTIVQTPQGATLQAVQFATLFPVTLPDGENIVENVSVLAQVAGTVGNIPSGGIQSFVTNPYTGATVTNPTAYANAIDTESEDEYKERIRQLDSNRSKGTPVAIEANLVGVVATDENKRIISSKLVKDVGFSTVYIDDGSGYEEKTEGIAFETLVSSAVGGEQYFEVDATRPVTKAFAQTAVAAPFPLTDGSVLAVEIGGVVYEHTFSASQFRAIGSGSSYEIVASINGNPLNPFSARTVNNGDNVAIFADVDTNEDIKVVTPSTATNANLVLQFPTAVTFETLKLYKNDVLLSKDGRAATLSSEIQAGWSTTIVSGDTLELYVDGTPLPGVVTFTNADFVTANTGYSTVQASNSLNSWATVINSKIPGITAIVESAELKLVSNKVGSTSQIRIAGGTLVTKSMFDVATSTGRDSDYTLDRNVGQITLSIPLVEGDKLTLGSFYTRGFIESAEMSAITTSADSELYLAIDGNSELIPSSSHIGTILQFASVATPTWGTVVSVTSSNTANLFLNAQVDDFIIITDAALNSINLGIYRISKKISNDTVYIERDNTWGSAESTALTQNGFFICRSEVVPYKVTIPAGTYTATNLKILLNDQLIGASASTFTSRFLRILTNSLDSNGETALVAQNREAEKLLLSLGVSKNTTSHVGFIQAGNSDIGTPWFGVPKHISALAGLGLDFPWVNNQNTQAQAVKFLRPVFDGTYTRSSNQGYSVTVETPFGGNGVQIRHAPSQDIEQDGTLYHADRISFASQFAMTPEDTLAFIVNKDTSTHRYVIPMYRKVYPFSTPLSTTNTFVDNQNSGNSLAVAFGTDFDWKDFAVYMKSRVTTGATADVQVLWRYYRHGGEGDQARISFDYQTRAGFGAEIDTTASNPFDNTKTWINVLLPSDAPRFGNIIKNTSKIGIAHVATSENVYTSSYVLGFNVASAVRTTNVTTATLIDAGFTTATGITNHGIQVNDVIYINSTNVNFTSGAYTVTAVAATTVSYAETAADVGATANIGTLTFDSTGESKLGGNVVVGDIFSILSGSPLPAAEHQALKLKAVGLQYWTGTSKRTGPGLSTSTTVTWYVIQDNNTLSFYPLNATDSVVSTIVTNLGVAGIIAPYLVGDGSGTLTTATYEHVADGGIRDGAGDYWIALTDGINYVRSTNTPASTVSNFVFTLKQAPTVAIADGWDSTEDVRLVPVTAKNIVDFYNSPGIGGLFGSSEVLVGVRAGSPQIATNTIGSAGSIQCQGGSANAVNAAVKGSAASYAIGSNTVATIDVLNGEAPGFRKNQWVRIDNENKGLKSRITSSTALSSITAAGVLTLTGTKAWEYANSGAAPITNIYWQFEKVGDFMSIVWNGAGTEPVLTGVKEGDYVQISGSDFNAFNQGLYRIVRVSYLAANYAHFWIVNAKGVDQAVTAAPSNSMTFVKYDSMVPGDTLDINTSLWNTNNINRWVISSLGATEFIVNLDVSNKTPTPVSGPIVLGTSYNLVRVIEGTASTLYKQVIAVYPNPTNTALTQVKLDSGIQYNKITEALGSVITILDKLEFGIDLATGTDGYTHSIGLIGAAAKVLYGDPTDPTTYPGIVAAGDQVNLAGPLIKRVTVSLALRLVSGDVNGIKSRVRSEVAAYINNSKMGKAVPIDGIIAAARKVGGVFSVTIISPVYGSGNDVIPAQPFEKPKIINTQDDITISIVGE